LKNQKIIDGWVITGGSIGGLIIGFLVGYFIKSN